MIMATVNQSMAGNALTQRQLYLATHIAAENTKPESDEKYNKL